MLKWVINGHHNNNNINTANMNGDPIGYCESVVVAKGEHTDHALMDKRFEELGITCPSCQQDTVSDSLSDNVDSEDGFIIRGQDADDRVFDLPIFVRGSDPLIQTARGKLQTRRSKLNEQINRELRMRAGAENLYKATNNKKLRETVGLELSFVNSNLQLLKEELADLNSSVDVYQNNGTTYSVPMIPLGLKETKDVDFITPFKEYILQHYSEDDEKFSKQLQTLSDLRQACRTPLRNSTGIQLMFEYYNQLYFVERRFFPSNRNLGVYFEWYDSLIGIPHVQRTVGFEKGSILFNIGALYTQIGARQDRSQAEGIDSAIENFQMAAGTFNHLRENFSHAPSMDMQPATLEMLQQLMLAQAQECVFESKVLGGVQDGMSNHINAAHEASLVAFMYQETHRLMTVPKVRDYVPFSWLSMVDVKNQYFKSLAYFHTATALINQSDSGDVERITELFKDLYTTLPNNHQYNSVATTVPKTYDTRKELAQANLRQAILADEEALRLHNLSKQLRRIDTFLEILKHSHDRSLHMFSELEEEDDFTELTAVPDIRAITETAALVTLPDFSKYKVEDYFHSLGPLPIFSARHEWSAPRLVELKKGAGQEFGFSVRGEQPVIIAEVDKGGLAERKGVKQGDFLVKVANKDIKFYKHNEVVSLMRTQGNHILLQVVTPVDQNFLTGEPGIAAAKAPSTPAITRMRKDSTASSATGTLKKDRERSSTKSSKSGTWNFRKRSKSRERKSRYIVNGSSSSSSHPDLITR